MIQTVPAVVIGGSLNALGVVRSLNAGGVPTVLLETTHRCPGRWSRHCKFVRVPSLEGRALVDPLRALAIPGAERPVLALTDDRAVETVSSFRAELEDRFRILLPAAAMVPVLADKTAFHAFAEAEGLPVPRSVTLRGRADARLLDELVPPLVLKPANKARVAGSRFERVVRADTLAHARDVVAERVERTGGLLVQEWIDGPDNAIYFALFVCDPNSQLVAHFAGRKIVCEPPRVGSTAVCTAAGEDSGEIERIARRYIAAGRYVGVGGLELKRDQRDGRFVVVEPTVGRTDQQAEIATLYGVNIALAAYRTALGLPVEPPRRVAATFAWRTSRRHQIPPGELPTGTRVVDGYFRAGDPLPAAYYYGYERVAARLWHLVSQPERWRARAARIANGRW
jgi:predicted ATP-grasp superfamily ATP-dependent carboligase